MTDRLEIRVHGPAGAPALIYLPGMHGDWCLVASFCRAVANRIRFVEFCYPQTTTWTLPEHAEAILEALHENEVEQGWLLGESFGSQIAWAILAESAKGTRFEVQGLVLAGGFVRYPWRVGVRLTGRVLQGLPQGVVNWLLRLYTQYARFRYLRAPETFASLDEFLRRRREPGDRAALLHRLDLIEGTDWRPVARTIRIPTWSINGLWDPVVPRIPVIRELRRECPGWRGERLLPWADHIVLATQPQQSAEVILGWMGRGE